MEANAKQNAPNSFESWDASWQPFPKELLIFTLTGLRRGWEWLRRAILGTPQDEIGC
jgi:hypothetical protein